MGSYRVPQAIRLCPGRMYLSAAIPPVAAEGHHDEEGQQAANGGVQGQAGGIEPTLRCLGVFPADRYVAVAENRAPFASCSLPIALTPYTTYRRLDNRHLAHSKRRKHV